MQAQQANHQRAIEPLPQSGSRSNSAANQDRPTDRQNGSLQKKLASTTRRAGDDTLAKINLIVDTLINWNSTQQDAQHQLRISIPIIKDLASSIGANYQPAIQQVLKDREQELDNHHSQFMLGFRHNASVFQKDEILRAIAIQFLHNDAETH
jgi:hypothetical protein